MIYLKYHILPTDTFKEEFKEIIYYIKRKLKEPLIAKRLYKIVILSFKSKLILILYISIIKFRKEKLAIETLSFDNIRKLI